MSKEGHIVLHHEHGINSRLMICFRCGEATGVALFGANDYVSKCNDCGLESYGGSPKDKVCPKCDKRTRWTKSRMLGKTEKIPGDLCEDCQSKDEEMISVIKEGGIYWRCSDCGSSGAIKKSPFAENVRAVHGIAAPDPCGIEFTKTDGCPVCGEKESE